MIPLMTLLEKKTNKLPCSLAIHPIKAENPHAPYSMLMSYDDFNSAIYPLPVKPAFPWDASTHHSLTTL